MINMERAASNVKRITEYIKRYPTKPEENKQRYFVVIKESPEKVIISDMMYMHDLEAAALKRLLKLITNKDVYVSLIKEKY